MRGRRNKHEWDYIGVHRKTGLEYGYCRLCDKYRYITNRGYTLISKKEFKKIEKFLEVD